MSAGIDVFSAVATVIATIDIVIRAMKELHDARERQIELAKVLSTHQQELHNIRQILGVVKEEPVLRVGEIVQDLQQLELLGRRLHKSLQELGKERGQFKQYTNQLFKGKRDLDDLAGIMISMGRAKENLSLKIQVVHVGLTRSVGDIVVVNCEMVEALDGKLQNVCGPGQGLKLAGLVQHKKRDRDGTIRLKDSEIASLSDIDNSSVKENDHYPAGTTSRMVDKNETGEQALQVNGPLGIGGFVEVDHLTITNNKARETSIQVNHGVSQDNFDRMLAARSETIRTMFSGGRGHGQRSRTRE